MYSIFSVTKSFCSLRKFCQIIIQKVVLPFLCTHTAISIFSLRQLSQMVSTHLQMFWITPPSCQHILEILDPPPFALSKVLTSFVKGPLHTEVYLVYICRYTAHTSNAHSPISAQHIHSNCADGNFTLFSWQNTALTVPLGLVVRLCNRAVGISIKGWVIACSAGWYLYLLLYTQPNIR